MGGKAARRAALFGEALGLFLFKSKMLLMRMMQYRFNFVMGLLVAFGFSALGPLAQFLLYSNSNGYPGWNWDQMLLFQAVLLLVNGLTDILFGSVRSAIDSLMEKGEFDRLLLRPYPPLMILLTSGFKPYGLGTVAVGAAGTLWAVVRIGVPAGALGFAFFFVFLMARLLLQAGVHILYCFFTVRWVYPMRLGEITDKILAYGNYPMEIYPAFLRALFTTALPFAIACYWPAKALLGPVSWSAFASLGGTALLVLVAFALWKRQLKSYVSGGG
jgi:ABC-2 type transport system permease protein